MSDIGEANRKHWDGRAAEYDAKPWQKTMMAYIYGRLSEHRDIFGYSKAEGKQEFRLLDYACGPGTVSRVSLAWTVLSLDLCYNATCLPYSSKTGGQKR